MKKMSHQRGLPRTVVKRATALGAAALLVGTGVMGRAHAAPAHAPITITLWSGISGPDQAQFIPLVNSFNASQGQYRVNYDQQSLSGYGQKLAAALSAGTPPTIFTADNVGTLTYMYQKVLTPLDSLIKKDKALAPGNFTNGTIQAVTYKKHVWGMPLDVTPLVMYYNKALFKKAGLNPNKPPIANQKVFLQAARKLTHDGHYGIVVPMAPPPVAYLWQTMVRQEGGVLFDTKKAKSGIDTTAGYNALKFLYDLVWTDQVAPKNVAADQDLKMLADGTAGMILDGSYQFSNPTLQSMGNNLGVSTVPKFGKKSTVFLGSLFFDLSAKASAAQKRAAMAWFQFYEKHSGTMGIIGDLSSYKPVVNSKSYKRYKNTVIIQKAVRTGYWPVFYPNLDTHWQIADAVLPVLQGQTTDIKAALAKAAQEINDHVRNSGG